jgi:hypothetical protein
MSDDDFKSRSAMKRVMVTDPYRVIAEVERLRAENARLRSGYLADENGNEYVAVCVLKEKIRELEGELAANNRKLDEVGKGIARADELLQGWLKSDRRLREALGFYADDQRWFQVTNAMGVRCYAIEERIGGDRARAALGETGEKA